VALLYQEAWLYGPDSALALGHQKEKIILLLMADTAHSSQTQRLIKTVQDAGRVQPASGVYGNGHECSFFLS
jgi:hypothetical protein